MCVCVTQQWFSLRHHTCEGLCAPFAIIFWVLNHLSRTDELTFCGSRFISQLLSQMFPAWTRGIISSSKRTKVGWLSLPILLYCLRLDIASNFLKLSYIMVTIMSTVFLWRPRSSWGSSMVLLLRKLKTVWSHPTRPKEHLSGVDGKSYENERKYRFVQHHWALLLKMC